MNNELDETREDDIEIHERHDVENTHECGNNELHEAAAQFLTEQTNESHDFQPGEIDPAQLEEAHRLSSELGDERMQNWLRNEVTEDLQRALDRIKR